MEYRYDIRFTTPGTETYHSCVDYLLYRVGGTGNPFAARSFILDADKTLEDLKYGALNYIARDDKLRKIHLGAHHYKIIFHVEEDTVYIDGVFHDSQNIKIFDL